MPIEYEFAFGDGMMFEPNEKDFLSTGYFLLFLMGILMPLIAFLLGGGLLSSVGSIIFVGVIYLKYISSKKLFITGIASSLPVLSLFKISAFVSLPVIGGTIGIQLIDIPLIILGFFGIYYARYSSSMSARLFIILSILLSIWLVITGLMGVMRGFSTSGLVFGIVHFRYVFVVGSTFMLVYWFGIRLPLLLLLTTAAYQTTVTLLQALVGPAPVEDRLIYLGEYGASYGLYDTIEILDIVIHTGKFAGGFMGSSRSLLAILILLFPVSVYVSFNYNFVPGYICMIGTPLMIIISAMSENGMAALLLMTTLITVLYIDRRKTKINMDPTIIVIGTVIGGFFALLIIIWILQSGTIPGSDIRWEQYVVAVQIFLNNPFFGAGGTNFPIVIESLDITISDRLFNLGDIHNIYLFYLYSGGFFGLTLLLLPLGISYWCTLENIVGTSKDMKYVGSLMIGIIGLSFFLFSSLVFLKPNVSVLFWMGLSMIVAKNTICDS